MLKQLLTGRSFPYNSDVTGCKHFQENHAQLTPPYHLFCFHARIIGLSRYAEEWVWRQPGQELQPGRTIFSDNAASDATIRTIAAGNSAAGSQ